MVLNGKMASGLKPQIKYQPSLWFAISLWVILNLADWLITIYHFSLGGWEANSVINLARYDITFLVMKFVVPVLITLLLWRINKAQWLLPLSAGMAVVVYWNMTWLLLV